MTVNVTGGTISEAEKQAYIERAKQKYPDKIIDTMDIYVDREFVAIDYYFKDEPFQRIRRITGYLVGDLSRFNNAKRAEVDDRVKHSIFNNGGITMLERMHSCISPTFGEMAMTGKEEIKRALKGELFYCFDNEGEPVYHKADKEECERNTENIRLPLLSG